MKPATAALRPHSRPLEPSPLGRLSSLPEHLLIERILPEAVEDGFLPGFQYASRQTLRLSLQGARHILTQQHAPAASAGDAPALRPATLVSAQAHRFSQMMGEPEDQRADLLVAMGQPKQARFWLEQAIFRHGAAPSPARSQALLMLGKFDSLYTGYQAALAAYDAALQAQVSHRRRAFDPTGLEAEVLRAEALIGLSLQPERTEAEAVRLRTAARLSLFRADIASRKTIADVAFWLGESYRLDARLVQPQQRMQLIVSETYFQQALKRCSTFHLARNRLWDVQRARHLTDHPPLDGHGFVTVKDALHNCQKTLVDCLLCTACRMGMADASLHKQDTSHVYRHYLAAHLDDPEAPAPNMGLALVLQTMPSVYQELELHEMRARAVLAVDPRDVFANNLLGRSLTRRGKYHEARMHLRLVLNHQPDDWDIKEQLANIELGLCAWDNALLLYQSMLVVRPNHGNALLGLARAYRGKGAALEASAYYCKTCAIMPDDVSTRREAISCLAQTVEHNLADAVTLHLLAGLLLKDGQLEAATTIYDQIVRIAPSDAEGLAGRARAFRCQHRWREAHADYSAAIAMPQKPDCFRIELALMLLEMGQLTEANQLVSDIARRAGITEETVPPSERKWLSDVGAMVARHHHEDYVTGILRRAYALHRALHPSPPPPAFEMRERAVRPLPRRMGNSPSTAPQSDGPTSSAAMRPAPTPAPAPTKAQPDAFLGAKLSSTRTRGVPSRERAPRLGISPLARHVLAPR